MATGKKPASDAGKELANKKTPQKMKEVAASALSQRKPAAKAAPKKSPSKKS